LQSYGKNKSGTVFFDSQCIPKNTKEKETENKYARKKN